MDPRTGETFGPMPVGDAKPGDELTAEQLREQLRKERDEVMEEKLAELARAVDHAEKGGTIVAVDAPAAQRARLGDREIRRRRQRRR